MIARVEGSLVVVADEVKLGEEGLRVVPVGDGAVDQAGLVQFPDALDERGANGPAMGTAKIANFVADAPAEDAGVVAVAGDRGLEVARPPVLEIDAVILARLLALVPNVEELVDHQDAQTVAGIQE